MHVEKEHFLQKSIMLSDNVSFFSSHFFDLGNCAFDGYTIHMLAKTASFHAVSVVRNSSHYKG